MFGSKIDFTLHFITIAFIVTFFGSLEVKIYMIFAALNLLLLFVAVGDFLPFLKMVPKFLQSVLGNVFSLLCFIPLFDNLAKHYIEDLKFDAAAIKAAFEKGVDDTGGYHFDTFCQSVCSPSNLEVIMSSKISWLNFWEESLKTLWWDAPPFAWSFALLSILLSAFPFIKKHLS
ncbi:hypothetical protein [Colwellia sp. Bg11-28]|uniref:hypothetical protein n=1 Tax=Colwellia sp. Bg11-28 TaxID=2058305 RepID=UPI000C343A76|nr:hypothetical protein [Colwellia sp. Bg11-28]PKH88332.1 hypothetical protein CXF79_06095 [Colwellia sp. Bg11-28]